MPDTVILRAGPYEFEARFETESAPLTVAAIRRLLPYRQKLIHVRWSGEAVWVPLGAQDFGIGYENHTSYPAPGQMLVYPGGISETEMLLSYGSCHFASKVGQLAGNHFLTITSNLDLLPKLGKLALWEGAQDMELALAG